MLSEEQLKIRLGGVSGSEIGAVAGLSPYETPLDVYLTKIGEAPPVEETPDMERGNYLEDGIAKWWAKRTGAESLTEPGTLVSRQNPIIIATPDRLAQLKGERLGVEVKAPRSYAKHWGNPGTDAVPDHIKAQTHWEMHVLDVERCDVAALIDDELCIYPIKRNANFEGLLIEIAERFWQDNVLKRVPPDAMAGDTETLKRLLPTSRAPQLKLNQLPEDFVQVLLSFKKLRTDYKVVTDRHDAIVNRIKQIMGEAEGIQTPWGRIDWKQNKPGATTDWKSAALEMQSLIALAASVHPQLADVHAHLTDVVSRCTKEKPGARPFVVRFSEAA